VTDGTQSRMMEKAGKYKYGDDAIEKLEKKLPSKIISKNLRTELINSLNNKALQEHEVNKISVKIIGKKNTARYKHIILNCAKYQVLIPEITNSIKALKYQFFKSINEITDKLHASTTDKHKERIIEYLLKQNDKFIAFPYLNPNYLPRQYMFEGISMIDDEWEEWRDAVMKGLKYNMTEIIAEDVYIHYTFGNPDLGYFAIININETDKTFNVGIHFLHNKGAKGKDTYFDGYVDWFIDGTAKSGIEQGRIKIPAKDKKKVGSGKKNEMDKVIIRLKDRKINIGVLLEDKKKNIEVITNGWLNLNGNIYEEN
ncbi:MAG: hypothetical protein ABUK01_15570, partial [Leptospirales bacterium]